LKNLKANLAIFAHHLGLLNMKATSIFNDKTSSKRGHPSDIDAPITTKKSKYYYSDDGSDFDKKLLSLIGILLAVTI